MLVLLGTTFILGQISKKVGLPSILGEMLGGVILEPTVLQNLAPTIFANVFPNGITITPQINSFIKLSFIEVFCVFLLNENIGYGMIVIVMVNA